MNRPLIANDVDTRLPFPRFEDCLTLDDYLDTQEDDSVALAEQWAEGAWLRHAESLGQADADYEDARDRALGVYDLYSRYANA